MASIEEVLAKNASKFKPTKHRAWDNQNFTDSNEEKTTAPSKKLNASAETRKLTSPQPAIKKSINETAYTEDDRIYSVDPSNIYNWAFHDRPETELGDIDSLAKDLQNVGQQQPCIVRPHPTLPEKYELIVGERRWRAATKAGIKLKVVIKNLTDTEAALSQAAENDNRKDLSDYAKGVSYAALIEKGIIEQKDLIEKLGKTKQYVSALLSFSKLPLEITEAIGDMSNVSARTAETMKRLSLKGQSYIEAIILNANKIREGKIGANKLSDLIEKSFISKTSRDNSHKIFSNDGRHLFTWRQDNNEMPSIHFPKNICALIKDSKIDMDSLSGAFKESIEGILKTLKSPHVRTD